MRDHFLEGGAGLTSFCTNRLVFSNIDSIDNLILAVLVCLFAQKVITFFVNHCICHRLLECGNLLRVDAAFAFLPIHRLRDR